MSRYIAFLRGINVSGQKIIKMQELRSLLSESGFEDVKTYIQSGNILFQSDQQDLALLTENIENLIEKHFGFHADVILRKYSEVERMMNSPFYTNLSKQTEIRCYITFLKHEYAGNIAIPLFSKNQDVEIIHRDEMAIISISTLYKGNYGFPNAFIEKLTGISATSRNPATIQKIIEL